jgi:hypothetical protein
MPQLRADLVDAFAGKVTQWDKEILVADSGFSNVMVEQVGRLRAEAAAWQAALETGALWWVSPEMTEVATTAAQSVPIDEIGLLDEDADRSGVIFWAGPTGASLPWANSPDQYRITSAFGSPTAPRLRVVAMAWRRAGSGLRLAALTDDPRAVQGARGPSPRTGIVEIKISEEARIDEVQQVNALLRATHALALQPGIGERHQETTHAPGPGKPRALEPQNVTVVYLRQPAAPPREDDDIQGPARRYSHQWIVGRHWRRQAVGKNRSERRLTWIAPHIKGPENTDLVLKDHVNVWKS